MAAPTGAGRRRSHSPPSSPRPSEARAGACQSGSNSALAEPLAPVSPLEGEMSAQPTEGGEQRQRRRAALSPRHPGRRAGIGEPRALRQRSDKRGKHPASPVPGRACACPGRREERLERQTPAEGANGSRLSGFACGRDDSPRKTPDLASPPRVTPDEHCEIPGLLAARAAATARGQSLSHRSPPLRGRCRRSRQRGVAEAATTTRQKHKWRPNQSVRRHRQAAPMRPCLNLTRPPLRCRGFFLIA